jgi:hypothetical protein
MASVEETLRPARGREQGEREHGGDVQERAKEKAADTQENVQQKAQQAASGAQDRLRQELDRRSTTVGEQIGEQASDLRSVGSALREQGKDRPAQAAERLAGYAERVGGYLREKDPDALLSDAEEMGRRRPWAAAAGGLALGIAASRLLKASSGRRYAGRSRRLTVPRPAGVYPAGERDGGGRRSQLPGAGVPIPGSDTPVPGAGAPAPSPGASAPQARGVAGR